MGAECVDVKLIEALMQCVVNPRQSLGHPRKTTSDCVTQFVEREGDVLKGRGLATKRIAESVFDLFLIGVGQIEGVLHLYAVDVHTIRRWPQPMLDECAYWCLAHRFLF